MGVCAWLAIGLKKTDSVLRLTHCLLVVVGVLLRTPCCRWMGTVEWWRTIMLAAIRVSSRWVEGRRRLAEHDDQVCVEMRLGARQGRVRRRQSQRRTKSAIGACTPGQLYSLQCWIGDGNDWRTLQKGEEQDREWTVLSRVQRVRTAAAAAVAAASAAAANRLWHHQRHVHPTVPTTWLSCSRIANRCRPFPMYSYTSAEYSKMVSRLHMQ